MPCACPRQLPTRLSGGCAVPRVPPAGWAWGVGDDGHGGRGERASRRTEARRESAR